MVRILINNSKGVSQPCLTDTEKLFKGWYQDVTVTEDLNLNLAGLNESDNPVLVIPGGSALTTGFALSKEFPSLFEELNAPFSVIGICAGAYLLPKTSYLFDASPHIKSIKQIPPQYLREVGDSFKLGCMDCQAFGPFYPNSYYKMLLHSSYESPENNMRPYETQVKFRTTGNVLSALYAQGPLLASKNRDVSVEASFNGRDEYSFGFPFEEEEVFPSSSAGAVVVQRNDASNKIKSLIVTGIHPEASVPNSSLLNFFTKEHPVKLSGESAARIRRDSLELSEEFKAILDNTLG
jgi:glutamine amidotransferase-like uncharacterized protein